MDRINQLMEQDILQLNQIITEDLRSNVVLINQISNYIINSGGKRIRPLLTLLCGRIAGYSGGVLLHKVAAMIEYIHTATLLHDDVVDESGLRRGRSTANTLFGNAASILVGDFIYTRAFQLMVEADSLRLLKIMADSTNKISEGEVLQLLDIGRSDLTEEEYFQVIRGKTATLFAAAARSAAIVAKADLITEDSLVIYATNLGMAFQIADDILDYTGDIRVMGKNVGDDLIEGKVTLPLIYLLKHGNSKERELIVQAINEPKQVDISLMVSIISQSDALKYCTTQALLLVDQAKEALDIFTASKYKEAMLELADLAVNRLK